MCGHLKFLNSGSWKFYKFYHDRMRQSQAEHQTLTHGLPLEKEFLQPALNLGLFLINKPNKKVKLVSESLHKVNQMQRGATLVRNIIYIEVILWLLQINCFLIFPSF